MEKYIARGKGLASSVPEAELIAQVKIRPLLYDKNVKEYRKPGLSETAWLEVASALNTSVSSCKKRWKSLRDTFIKYYRIEQTSDKSCDSKNKERRWHFYNDLKFLKSHVELYRLEGVQKDENIPIYLKEDFAEANDEEKHFFYEDESDSITYQIKINQDFAEDENLLETITETPAERILDEEHYTVEEEQSKDNTVEKSTSINELPVNETRSTSDPDEQYLNSLLPAFKRLTPQQKSLVRIGIEKLFYEVEFSSEPSSKRFKSS